VGSKDADYDKKYTIIGAGLLAAASAQPKLLRQSVGGAREERLNPSHRMGFIRGKTAGITCQLKIKNNCFLLIFCKKFVIFM
jgi:hypothetical protein